MAVTNLSHMSADEWDDLPTTQRMRRRTKGPERGDMSPTYDDSDDYMRPERHLRSV